MSTTRLMRSIILIPLGGEAELTFGEEPGSPSDHISFEAGTLAHFVSAKRHRVWNPSRTEAATLLVLRMYAPAKGRY